MIRVITRYMKSNAILKADASCIYVINNGCCCSSALWIYSMWSYTTAVSSHRCTMYPGNNIRVPAV